MEFINKVSLLVLMNKKIILYQEYYKKNHSYERNLTPMYRLINTLINFKCKSLLDYGCGKGNLAELFLIKNSLKIYKYDPAIDEYKTIENNLKVDVITNCDVMEHIPETEIDNVLKQMASISDNIFFNIYLKEAKTILPNGENAHCTVKPSKWWINKIKKYFKEVNIIQTSYKNSVSIITWKISYKERIKLILINLQNYLEYLIWRSKYIFSK